MRYTSSAQNNPTSISGFDINFDNKGEGNGNSKYIGQISKFNNNQDYISVIEGNMPVILIVSHSGKITFTNIVC